MTTAVRFHEYGGPEVLRLEEVEPGEPGPGEVRLRVEAIGLNRAEALFRGGRYLESVRHFPARIGTEAAGVVEAVGSGVSGLAPGQPVSTVPGFPQERHGVYAEQAVVPAASVLARPEQVGAVEGAAVWMAHLTAYGALVEAGGLRPGDTVVLNAASSSVGLAALRLVRRLGATPVALTRTAAKREALLREGAAEVIVTGETDPEGVARRVREVSEGRGAELVFDAVAGPGVVDLARLAAPGGTLLVYGALSGQPTPYPGLELGLPALNMRSFTMAETARDPERLRRAAAFIVSGLLAGSFRAVVDRTFELREIVEAHRYLESNAQVGKIVVTVPH